MIFKNKDNIKKDCFAYNGKTCKALDNTYCAMGKCKFYKTKEQAKKDEDKVFERLVTLSYKDKTHYVRKYGLRKKMKEKGLIE